ncbi:MAG: hypothetical protein OEV08_00905 [Nitrospira sp.]|nr:hypothetical protein [Nitrospira sp.]
MATSNVSIANLALQKLGAPSIVALDENSVAARAINACFEAMRDRELRAYFWKFAKRRATLAPHATVPDFSYALAFPLPVDFLRLIKPARVGLDWHLEYHEGVQAILTNDGDELEIRYIAKITDPTLFDPMFVEMLACKIAWHCCEQLTQSNSKKQILMEEYRGLKNEARQVNAFEVHAQPQPVDEWLTARWNGQLVNSEFDEE